MTPEEGTRRLERAGKLVEALREHQAKVYEITEELQKILGGERSSGEVLKRLETLYSDEWERRYGAKYAFVYAKDRPHWKRLAKLTSESAVVTRVMCYFADRDPYITTARHPFGLFVSRFNNYADAPVSDLVLSAPVVGCRHEPRCVDDQRHTIRRREDRVAGQSR